MTKKYKVNLTVEASSKEHAYEILGCLIHHAQANSSSYEEAAEELFPLVEGKLNGSR